MGGYYGVSGSLFAGYGVTAAAGVYWDNSGPGLYLRGGAGVGFQMTGGTEMGLIAASISGAAVEAEVVGMTRSVSGSMGLTGATALRAKTGSRGSKINPMPVSGHVAGTYTAAVSLGERCK